MRAPHPDPTTAIDEAVEALAPAAGLRDLCRLRVIDFVRVVRDTPPPPWVSAAREAAHLRALRQVRGTALALRHNQHGGTLDDWDGIATVFLSSVDEEIERVQRETQGRRRRPHGAQDRDTVAEAAALAALYLMIGYEDTAGFCAKRPVSTDGGILHTVASCLYRAATGKGEDVSIYYVKGVVSRYKNNRLT
jgi:hypothetical protein